MKRLRYKRPFLLALLFCLIVTGCGYSATTKKANPTEDTASSQNEKKLARIKDEHSNDGKNIVGISMPSHSLERWNRDGTFLKKSFEEAGYEVQLSFSDDLIDTQIDDIDDMIQNKVDVLLVAPIDGSALTEVLRRAAAANIKIISYDRLLMKTVNVDYYVSFDNYRVGQLQGKFVEKTLHLPTAKRAQYNIEIISGDPADNNARYFYQGAYDVLEPYLSNGAIEVGSNQKTYYETAISSWSTELAQERFVSILNSYYLDKKQLDAVVCANDSTARGVTAAIASEYKGKNPVVVTGQDADEPNLKDIQEGRQSMTVFKALANEAVVASALTHALFEGETPNEAWIASQDFGFDVRLESDQYDNGEKKVPSLLLAPLVITKDNIEDELIKPGYYKRDQKGNIKAVN